LFYNVVNAVINIDSLKTTLELLTLEVYSMGWNILSPSHLILNVDALITPFNGSHSKIQRAANKNQLEKLVKWFAKL